jgi:hypothetical protein
MRSEQRARLKGMVVLAGVGVLMSACGDVLSSPSTPASIEFQSFAAPAVVIGDTLRDIDGLVAPVVAVVRNQQGDVLADAAVRYTYADAARDSALLVDSASGVVFSKKALATTGTNARIAARVGGNLQIVRTILVTTRPDSVDRGSTPGVDTLRVVPTDTAASSQTSGELAVVVRHLEGTTSTQVPNWMVKFVLTHPSNPTNDSTKSAFLVNDLRRLSNIDTTNGSGIASRFVRVRAAQFPATAAPDSAVVEATVSYKGQPLKGSPVRIVVPIIRKP